MNLVAQAYADHCSYWLTRRQVMDQCARAYSCQLSKAMGDAQDRWSDPIETQHANQAVESVVSTLYPKALSVKVGPPTAGPSNVKGVEAILNSLLAPSTPSAHTGVRLSLIYPFACYYLASRPFPDLIRKLELHSLRPQEVLIDRSARSWSTMQYVGVVRWIPVSKVLSTYRVKAANLAVHDCATDYPSAEYKQDRFSAPPENGLVRVIEFYDLINDKLIEYSPDLRTNDGILRNKSILSMPTDDMDEEELASLRDDDSIPARDRYDVPVVPIIPVYMAELPDRPLEGSSLVERSLSYFKALFVHRNRIYEASKQITPMFYTNAKLDADTRSAIKAGRHGTILTQLQSEDDKPVAFAPIPVADVPQGLYEISQVLESDLQMASNLAPFTRGEESEGATATEIRTLSAYSSSMVGQWQLRRDQAIDAVCRAALATYAVLLQGETVEIVYRGEAISVTAEELLAEYTISVYDGGQTPLSDSQVGEQLVNLAPVLERLGSSKTEILRAIVSTLKLPEALIPNEAPNAVPPQVQSNTPGSSPGSSEAGGQPPATGDGLGGGPVPAPVPGP